ncbi:MAG: OmpH family outer membrane protein [Paracoccaceae bacterium]|nr:OmpH family outer membrane protein [Paracoccaceae bacterium]
MSSFFKIFLVVLTGFSVLLLGSGKIIAQTKTVPVESNNFQENLRRSILVISNDKIFYSTELGKALIKKLQESEEILRIEADQVESYFVEEEQKLTKDRLSMSSEEFVKLSEDFDRRVEIERLNQRQKEQVIKQRFNKWKRDFRDIYIIPVVEKFMQVYGASIVIDIDSQAFRSVIVDSRINITDRVISQMNTSYYNIEELLNNITLQ